MKVSIIGATGRAGGWVLEECLDRGYSVSVLARSPGKLESFQGKISVVEGDAANSEDLKKLVAGADVVISAIGSPNKETLVVKKTAEALVKALEQGQKDLPRILWVTANGINEATEQAKSFPLFGKQPSTWFFGYGLFGFLQFKLLIPYVISQALWDDMAESEDVIRSKEAIVKKTTIIRPGNMKPAGSEAPAFSDQWRQEGGEDMSFVWANATDPPPGIWIVKKALAKAIVSLVEDSSKDGTAVSVFQPF